MTSSCMLGLLVKHFLTVLELTYPLNIMWHHSWVTFVSFKTLHKNSIPINSMYNSTSSSRLNLLYIHDRSLRVIYINGIKTMISRVISLNFVPHYLEKLGLCFKNIFSCNWQYKLVYFYSWFFNTSKLGSCMYVCTHTYIFLTISFTWS